MSNELPSVVTNLRSTVDSARSTQINDGAKAEANVVLNQDLPKGIEEAVTTVADTEQKELSPLANEVIGEADRLMMVNAATLRQSIQENQHAKAALLLIQEENRKAIAGPNAQYFDHNRKAALKFLLSNHDVAKKKSQTVLAEEIKDNPEARAAVKADIIAIRTKTAEQTVYNEKETGRGPSEILLRGSTDAITAKHGDDVYHDLISDNSFYGEVLGEKFSDFEDTQLESDRVLLRDYLRRASSEDRGVLIGLRYNRSVEDIPEIRGSKTMEIVQSLVDNSTNTIVEEAKEDPTLLRGNGRSQPSRSMVSTRVELATDMSLTSLVRGMQAIENPPSTSSELQGRITAKVKELDDSNSDPLRNRMVASRYSLGFFAKALDEAMGGGDLELEAKRADLQQKIDQVNTTFAGDARSLEDELHEVQQQQQKIIDEQLYQLKIAIDVISEDRSGFGPDLIGIYGDIAESPEDYPLNVRQLFAIENPLFIQTAELNESIYGTNEERENLRIRLDELEKAEEMESLRNQTVESGAKLFGIVDTNKRADKMIKRHIEGRTHRPVTAEQVTRIAILEQTQELILEDIANLDGDGGVGPVNVTEVLRDVDVDKVAVVKTILASEEAADDIQKRTVALLALVQLHLDMKSSQITVESLLNATKADGSPLITPVDLVNVHNLCLARVDAANMKLSEDHSGGKDVEGLRFRNVIYRHVDAHRSTIRYGDFTPKVPDPFVGLELHIDGTLKEDMYPGVTTYYYDGGNTPSGKYQGYHMIKEEGYGGRVHSVQTQNYNDNTKRGERLAQLRKRVDPLSMALEISVYGDAVTEESEAVPAEAIETAPAEVETQREGEAVDISLHGNVKDFEPVFKALGMPRLEENLPVLGVADVYKQETGRITVINGLGAFDDIREIQIAGNIFGGEVGKHEEDWRTRNKKKFWVTRKGMFSDRLADALLKLSKYSENADLGIIVGRIRPAENEEDAQVLYEEEIDRALAARIKEQLDALTIESDIDVLRANVLAAQTDKAPRGSINVGNLEFGTYSPYGLLSPEGKKFKYEVAPQVSTHISRRDLEPESGLVNVLIDHKIAGLQRLLSKLDYIYGPPIDIASEVQPAYQRDRYKQIAVQQARLQEMMAALEAKKFLDVDLEERIDKARKERIDSLRSNPASDTETLPAGYIKALEKKKKAV